MDEQRKLFVTSHEKSLLQKALSTFDQLTEEERDRLQNFYSAFGLFDVPREDEIREQLMAIANREFLDIPGPLINLMRRGIPANHMDCFWQYLSINHLAYIHHKQRPTPEKVASIIEAESPDLTVDEDRIMYYLIEFVSTLDSDSLSDFLILTTASIHQPVKIVLTFNSMFGLQRRPIMHTCSNTIELPTSYNNYQEFRREFRAVLSNPDSLIYSAI